MHLALTVPSVNDKIIQEIIKELLQSIYEPLFSNSSHGFRPNRSCHTALLQIKQKSIGSSWAIEGDIKGFFDTIDHDILINILKQKIQDGRFIELISRFLKAGYISNGIRYDSITGTPQGGIISPILANIYLNELDIYMEQVITRNTKGKIKKLNDEYTRLMAKINYRRKTGKIKEAHELIQKLRTMSTRKAIDPDFVRINYVRYADDFVVFIIGSKNLAVQIRNDVANFLNDKLKLNLNMDKTFITNLIMDKAKFLGYEIFKAKVDSKMIKDTKGRKRRSINGTIQLQVPIQIINKKIKEFSKNGRPFHKKDRIYLAVEEMIKKYNSEIRGLYNYYRMAYNVSNYLNKFKYYHYYSLCNTICRKENISLKKMIDKYGISVPKKTGTGTRKVVGITYQKKDGTKKELTYFNESLGCIKNPLNYDIEIDKGKVSGNSYSELLTRLNIGKCELCWNSVGSDNIVVHHERKLKDLLILYSKVELPKWVKQMKIMNRKTLIVCHDCHKLIHNLD